jgi:chorismate synthase
MEIMKTNAGHPRPGHADFTAHAKYGEFEDRRGGGHLADD